MQVCPFCRASNPEDLAVCQECGRELRAGIQPMTSALRKEAPFEDEPRPPAKTGPRWGRIAVLGAAVLVVGGLVLWLVLRPQPCDHKFSSTQFAYCLSLPDGWNASTAQVGSTGVDQFVNQPATAVVISVPLRPGFPLSGYVKAARDQDRQKHLTVGPQTATTLGGMRAYQWSLGRTGTRYQGLEVVTVRDDVGWTVQLNDDEATYPRHLDEFRSMLQTFHFR